MTLVKKVCIAAVILAGMSSACNGDVEASKVTGAAEIESINVPEQQTSDTDGLIGNISGEMAITGTFKMPVAGNWVYLWETEGKLKHLIDSAKVTAQGFSFPRKIRSIGIYQIGFDKERNVADLILNPQEGDLQIAVTGPQARSGLTFTNSNENRIWTGYIRNKATFDGEINQLRNQRSQGGGDVKPQIEAKMSEIAALQKKTAADNPGTFSAKVLAAMSSPAKNDKAKYWDDLNFGDPSYIRSEVLNERIQEYMRNHSGGNDKGYYQCIDTVTEKAKENQEVLEFMMYTMLDGFYSSNMENICAYMLDNVIYGDGCGVELSDFLLKRAGGVQSLRMGNVPPDFTIETDKGTKLTLSKVVKANQYTLVMFWSSWCHKCEEEIPQLLPIYSQYKAKGFEVVGVSIDNTRRLWLDAVSSKQITFPTVCQLKGWESPVVKDYKITATPVLILLDKDMKIVAKPLRIFDVKNFLAQNLK